MPRDTRTGPGTAPPVASLRRLVPFLRPYRARIALALLLLTLGSATLLLVPLAFRDLVDFGLADGGRMRDEGLFGALNLGGYFLALFGLAALWAVLVSARYYVVTWIGERLTADLRSAVYARMLRQSPEYFETLQPGEVISRLTGDTTLVQTVVGSSASMGLRSLFQFTGGMIMLAVTSFQLFALNIALMALLALPIVVIGRRLRRLSRESQDRIADASALAGERLHAVPTVQSFMREDDEATSFSTRVDAAFATAIRRTRVRAALTALIITAVLGAIVFVLFLGALQVRGGTMTAGELGSFVLYAAIVAGGVATIAEVWGDLMRAAGATERLLELLGSESAIAEPVHARTAPIRGAIAFERVTFRYPSRPHVPALEDIGFEVRPGERIALVGPSGAGKTTVFQLLLRFYDVTEGRILIDGLDVRDHALAALRARIALVPQDPVIFSADALDNIRYGRADASDDEVRAAARAAYAEEFIESLADGYRTFLGERGTRLSGGQRQRIAIARAILKDAPVLLLDEATSALDAESEAFVQSGLDAAMQGRTTLIIAHRLATVRKADRIVVLESGRIVETGTPADLRQQSGLYARLAKMQFDTRS